MVLEDITSMHETLMDMAVTAAKTDSPIFELADSSSILPFFRLKGKLSRAQMPNGTITREVILEYEGLTSYRYHINPQTELEFWDHVYKWRIGDDSRYIKLRERISALIKLTDTK